MGIQKGLERKETFEVHNLLPILKAVNDEKRIRTKKFIKKRILLNGDVVRVDSLRIKCFVYKGLKCARCGIVGEFFAKERQKRYKEAWHLNLYARVNGDERLITMDYVIPSSKGGNNSLKNSQTLCIKCNGEKADKV